MQPILSLFFSLFLSFFYPFARIDSAQPIFIFYCHSHKILLVLVSPSKISARLLSRWYSLVFYEYYSADSIMYNDCSDPLATKFATTESSKLLRDRSNGITLIINRVNSDIGKKKIFARGSRYFQTVIKSCKAIS